MRFTFIVLLMVGSAFTAGCSTSAYMDPTSVAREGPTADVPGSIGLPASLFKSDQAVMSNEDIEKILSSKVYPPSRGRMAVVRIGGRYPVGRTWWSENVAQLEQQSTDGLVNTFRSSPRLSKVVVLPTMLTPAQTTVPYLREAAARVQADTLLVYRTFTQNYQKQRFFGNDEVHAYCTVEAVLLDTRTGIITDASVKTHNMLAGRSSKDIEFEETVARAEQQATGAALAEAAAEPVRNLNAEPMPPVPTTQAARAGE
ncbi:MAG: hypothetical protein JWN51_1748 [Phycisphaerales bacterium]|nr:hypothetical protein [Phycisphaerales bacterium]